MSRTGSSPAATWRHAGYRALHLAESAYWHCCVSSQAAVRALGVALVVTGAGEREFDESRRSGCKASAPRIRRRGVLARRGGSGNKRYPEDQPKGQVTARIGRGTVYKRPHRQHRRHPGDSDDCRRTAPASPSEHRNQPGKPDPATPSQTMAAHCHESENSDQCCQGRSKSDPVAPGEN